MAVAEYQLTSELARVCLPAPEREATRRLAWANSICLVFVIIGVVGDRSKLPPPEPLPPLEAPVALLVEPPPPVVAQTTEATPTDAQSDDEKPSTPQVQSVTLDTPAINFAVPTPGSLLVPLSMAQAPVARGPVKMVAPAKQEPTEVQSSGHGGERPRPERYPTIAQQLGMHGTVVLLVTVDDEGRVVSAEIHESSGWPILDDDAQKWVKKHWTIPPINGGHVFFAPIRYKLQ